MQKSANAEIPLAGRDNLSGALVLTLRSMIVDGRLPAGQRVNEVHLARAMGVSRTPLREALARLAQEGALSSAPRLGWSVRPLSIDEFEQIYAIRPLLEPEALRLAGLPSRERLERLRTLNVKIEHTRNADAVIALDDEWHLSLIAECPNKVLIELVEQFIHRTRRYEMALMDAQKSVLNASFNHKAIITALKVRDLVRACDALRRNLQSGREPILAWLKERPGKGAKA